MVTWPAPDPADAVRASDKVRPGLGKKIRRTRPSPGRVARRTARAIRRDSMLLQWHDAMLERDARIRYKRLSRLEKTLLKYSELESDSEISESKTKDGKI